MRKFLYIAAVLSAGLLTACNKEWGPDMPGKDGQYGVSLRLEMAPMQSLKTKADAIGAADDDFIDRLDIFVYNSKDTVSIGHHVYSNPAGVDLSAVDVKYYDVGGTNIYFFILANLDPATAEYFASLSRTRVQTYYGGLITLEKGNYRPHRHIMGGVGTAYLGPASYYSSSPGDKVIEIKLYRYICRFDIEKITANFDDAALMNSDVIVKRIAWINVPNALRPLFSFPSYNQVESPSPLWGSRSTYFPEYEFGNLEYESGYRYYQANENHHGWVSLQETYNLSGYGATGALAADFPYIYNNNFELEKGVLNIDAPADIQTATVHTFTGETGRICSSTNPSQSHVLNVGRSFYVYPNYRNSYSTYMCTSFNGQDDTTKLVIEVEIDGKTYFYPYRAMNLQPNSIYKVRNISLRGIGSDYSNFYVKKYSGEISPVTITGWDELEVSNIDMGYKDYPGTEIY